MTDPVGSHRTSLLRVARMSRPAFVLLAVLWWGIGVPSAGALGGGSSTTTVRLQLASFASEPAAQRFASTHQLAWNECVLGKRLGVVPPGRTDLPARCTAQVEVVVLDVVPAVVGGRTVYRVVTRPFAQQDLWGALEAYRLAGVQPVVIK